MMSSPAIAGLRVHRGTIIGPGNWPAILDEDTWQALRARLSAPRVVHTTNGHTYPANGKLAGRRSPGLKYLLTGGLTVCGVCGARLGGSIKQLKGQESKPFLLCQPKLGGRACVGILLAETEQLVVDVLFAELDKPEFLEAVAADDHAAQREALTIALQAAEGRRAQNAELWGAGQLTDAEWKAARDAIDAREAELRGHLAELPPPAVKIDIAEARAAWPSMLLDEQREFVRMFIDRVTINRAKPGTTRYDPGRVAVTWRYV
jgi:hypothetical protein